MKICNRLLALVMALCLLLPTLVWAEDDEIEYSLLDEGLIEEEEVLLDDEEGLDDFEIADGEAETIEEDLDTLDREPDIDENDLEINPNLPDNVLNILLIGVDMRDQDISSTSSLLHNDVTMILSVNLDDGSIKLTSILRDLYVPIPGYKDKGRLNVAYARGSGKKNQENNRGAALTMRTVNHNFEMNISEYVVINFYGLAAIIDYLGGIDVDLIKGEAYAINEYLRTKGRRMTYDVTGNENREPLKVETSTQHLDGIQAVMYARLRSKMASAGTGDFARTARQRHLLELLLKKVLEDIDINKLGKLIQVAYPYVRTNISASTMLQLALSVLQGDIISRMRSGEEVLSQHRVPLDRGYSYSQVNGASVITMSSRQWDNARQSIHYFIYGNYYPAK